jgi:hypothetical protein
MVDLSEIQAAYYMVAATGVLVAAAYYILNMRATLESRRIGLIDSLSSRLVSNEGMKNYFEMMNWEWSNYEDFERKYGSDNNLDAAAKRFSYWTDYNSIGSMVRKRLISIEDVYDMGFLGVVFYWAKYKSIIEENRRRYNGEPYLRDFEYLCGELLRYMKTREPSYQVPATLSKYVPER